MGAYKYIKQNFQKSYKERDLLLKGRVAKWREESSVHRLEKPTNVARARELGYKAKQGVVVARVRIRKGKRKREKASGGRKPSKSGRFFAMKKSLQSMAEERASRKFRNCEVMNSYYTGEDGKFKFYEIILLDRDHISVRKDPMYAGIAASKGRSFRGLTSSGDKHRGMDSNTNRPSVRTTQRGVKV